MNVCMYICIYVFAYICMHVYTYIYMYMSLCACVFVLFLKMAHRFVRMVMFYVGPLQSVHALCINLLPVYMFTYKCVHTYKSIYIYIHRHICTCPL